MARQTKSLEFSCAVKVPPKEIYHAFTRAVALREWLCDFSLADPRVGGRLCLGWINYYVCGRFEALVPDEMLRLRWYNIEEPGMTQVNISLVPREDGTEVTLTHTGLGDSPEWNVPRERFQKIWAAGLENLKSVLETGLDLRYLRRPMLGILYSDIRVGEHVRRTILPVKQGLRVDFVLDGAGAGASGVQEGDILVSLGGRPLGDICSYLEAISHYQSGDEVELVFFRGKNRQAVPVKLMHRQMTDVPATAEALARAIKEIYVQLEAELEQIIDGVSEEEASQAPAEGEWSIKEILAHLILQEQDLKTWLASLILSEELPVLSLSNLPVRNSALLAIHSALSALVHRLSLSQNETVAMLLRLPAEFVSRKRSYVRTACLLTDMPYHYQVHFDQIRAVLDTLRSSLLHRQERAEISEKQNTT